MANPYVVAKTNARGEQRFTGMYYDLKGKPRSAGTFSDREQAMEATQKAQAAVALPSALTPTEKQTITLEELWPRYCKATTVEPNSLQGYEYTWWKHVHPYFGRYKIAELQQDLIRYILKQMGEEENLATTLLQQIKAVLGIVLSYAVELGIRPDNPAHGIVIKRNKRDQKKPIQVLSPEMWWLFCDALEEDVYRLFAELMVSSGARLCEMVSFVEGDLDYDTRDLAITKSTVEVTLKHSPDGNRYVTRPYTKNGDTRVVRLGRVISQKIRDHVQKHGIKEGELWFPSRLFLGQRVQAALPRLTPDQMAEANKATIAGPNGRAYHHGTHNAYIKARCKCRCCLQFRYDWMADKYHAKRAAEGKPSRRIKKIRSGPMDHLSQIRWGDIFRKARKKVGLTLTPYQLRHTHGSWLLRDGASLPEVQERLGHHSISSTTKYLWVVPGGDDKIPLLIEQALGYGKPDPADAPDADPMAVLFAKMEELKAMITAGGGTLPQKVIDLDSHRQVVDVNEEPAAS